MKEMWDERYSVDDYVYGIEPNAFFQQFIDTNTPGSLLLAGEGEGRNAVYAAQKGWQVYAVDYSLEAQKKAFKLAAAKEVTIRYDVADLSAWNTHETFDVVGLFYAHFPESLRSVLHHRMKHFLKNEGHVLLEAFSKQQLQYDSGGPRKEEMLYSCDALAVDFEGLFLHQLQQLEVELDAGLFHKGKASIIQMHAQKIS